MHGLLRNVRFYVLSFSIVFSLLIFLWVKLTVASSSSQIIQLEESYGVLAVCFLYLALLAGPFCYRFKSFPYTSAYLHSRRAIGVSTFYFAFLHTWISFFDQLGGFAGLNFLSNYYIFAIVLGFVALVIFFFLTITSLDKAVKAMHFSNWKLLHRFIYLAGILVLIHIVLLGAHYSDLSNTLPLITFLGLVFLLYLEEPRFYKFIKKVFPQKPVPQLIRSGVVAGLFVSVIFYMYTNVIMPLTSPQATGTSFSVHAAHEAMTQAAMQDMQMGIVSDSPNAKTLPGLDGDRTKRFTVSMISDPINPQPNEDVTIHFQIYDANSGNRVTYFRLLYTQLMHMIVVNSNLTYFKHIHPMQDGQDFAITTQFPKNDMYHLYIQFQPLGGIEQQMAFTIPVGTVPSKLSYSNAAPDNNQTKKFGDYKVSMDTHGPLQALAMTRADQQISLTLTDAETGYPVKNLKPYLGSFGHLTLINEKTFDFIHVHPADSTPPLPDANGGPKVDFLPMGIYSPFKPGIYRAFAEFNPNNTLFTADFTVQLR